MRFISLRDLSASHLNSNCPHFSEVALTENWTAFPVSYRKVWELQKQLVEKVSRGDYPNTVLFVEHSSVITRGRGLQWKGEVQAGEHLRHAAAPDFSRLVEPMEIIEVERGGDLTWHGPGQLIAYPIFRLDGREGPNRDVEATLRGFEQVVNEVLAEFSLKGFVKKNAAGVWVRSLLEEGGGDRKIASLGIGVRKWTTFHGIALNVVNSLSSFQAFSPCGFPGEVMTSLLEMQAVSALTRGALENKFIRAFQRIFPGNAEGETNFGVQEIDALLESIR